MDGSNKIDCDYLKFAGDKSILEITKDEQILFTDKVTKTNRFGFSQERNILVTNKAVYNLKKKTLKRRIDIGAILGITISKLTDEFVIHGNENEYDYDYVSWRRKRIIECINKGFVEITKKEMKLCELDQKSLKNCVTTKKEKKKDPSYTRMSAMNIIPVCTYLYGTKAENPNLNKKSATIVRNGTLYSKRKDITEVKLEDFRVLKVLGRGSFGKVCMVEFTPTKEIYAMKTLKKDVLIDQDQIDNTLLEKKILESLDHPFLVGLTFCFQTEERLYFVMPFLRGGELFQHLRKFRIFDEEK
jgi:serum/glucocorticoid-regulated kinase 2